MANASDLFSPEGMDAANLSGGVKEIREALSGLNKELAANKEQVKALAAEMSALQRQQAALAQKMQAGEAAKQEQERYEDLGQTMVLVQQKMTRLQMIQMNLNVNISSTTQRLGEMNQELKKTAPAGDSASRSLSSTMKSLGNLAKALKSAATFTKEHFYDFLIGSNAQMEQFETQFSAMLGSREKAKTLMEELAGLSSKSPLKLTDTADTAGLLLGYGVTAEALVPTMAKLGDLSLGNAEKLDAVAKAYGEMLSAGKVSSQGLNQMAEAGVPLLQALANSVGKTTGEVEALVSKGAVGLPALNAAIDSLATGSGDFAGKMEEQSHTFNGMLSSLEEAVTQFGRDAGQEAFAEVKGALGEVMAMLDKARQDGSLQEFAQSVGSSIGSLVKILAGAVQIAWQFRDALLVGGSALAAFKIASAVAEKIENFKKAQKAATLAQAAFNAVANVNPYVLLLTAVTALANGIVWLANANSRAVEKQRAKTRELTQTYEETQSELEGVNQKLKETGERMNQLKAKGTLTLTEAGELEKLEKVNQELELQARLLEKKEERTQKELAASIEAQYAQQVGAQFGKKEMSLDAAKTASRDVSSYAVVKAGDNASLAELITGYSKIQGEIEQAIADKDLVLADDLLKKKDGMQARLEKHLNELSEWKLKLMSIPEARLTDGQAALKEKLDKDIDFLAKSLDAEWWKATKFKELTGSKEYQETAKGLTALAREGKLTAKTLEDPAYAHFKEALDGIGVTTGEAVAELAALAGQSEEASGALSQTGDTAAALIESYHALASAESMVNAVEAEWNQTGALSVETLEKITKQYPQLTGAVADLIAGLQTESDVLQALKAAYDTDVQNFYQFQQDKLQNNNDFYNLLMQNNTEYFNKLSSVYKIDLENCKTYAQAKAKIVSSLQDKRINDEKEFRDYQIQISGSLVDNPNTDLMLQMLDLQYEVNSNKLLGELNNISFEQIAASYQKFVSKLNKPGNNQQNNAASGIGNTIKQEISQYELANEAFKKLSNEKIDQINAENDARKEALDLALESIDKELEARKRLKEDTSVQDEIDAVQAQLKYGQLDEFSRMELEKQLKALRQQKEDTSFERQMADRKTQLQESYNTAVEGSKATIADLQKAMSYANNLFTDLRNGAQSVTSIINNNSKSANVNIVNNALTAGQISQKVIGALMDGVI